MVLNERAHVKQANTEGEEIEDVHIGLHEVEDKVQVLQAGQVVLVLEALVDVEDESGELVDDGVLVVVGEFEVCGCKVVEVVLLGGGQAGVGGGYCVGVALLGGGGEVGEVDGGTTTEQAEEALGD